MTSPSPDAPLDSAPAPTTAPWLPIAAVAVTLVLWASAFVAIRHVAHEFTPGALTLGRLVPGVLVLLVALLTSRSWVRPTPREWGAMAAIGVLWFFIYNVALNAGEQRIDAGTASLLLQVSPILIAVLAATFLAEKFTTGLVLGLTLAFCGVALISFADTPSGSPDAWGVALCLIAAVVYSISLIVQKPLVGRLPALQITTVACAVGMLCALPFAGQLATGLRAAPADSGWWLVYLGVFPTAIAFTTYAWAQRYIPTARLGVTTYLVPPITIVLGLVFLGETPPWLAYVGGALALLGVAVARRR